MQRYPSSWWWFLIPLLTLGFGTFAIVGFAAVKQHRFGAVSRSYLSIAAAVAYLAVDVAYFSATSTLSPGAMPYEFLVSLHILVCWAFGTAHVAVLQHLEQRVNPAVAAARWRLQRRSSARRIVETNPAMAIELRIGRPDIASRDYEDGGLIDVNHVPAELLRSELEMTPAQADSIIAVRDERGGFTTADEIILHCAMISPARFEAIRDRLIALPL